MGSKQTKLEAVYFPDSPTLNRIARQLKDAVQAKNDAGDDIMDPRSPSGRRTPLEVLQQPSQQQLVNIEAYTAERRADNPPLSLWRKRFSNKGSYDLNDPRSPQLNRTPLMLDEAIDRTLNLNDTFADLFVESNIIEGRDEANEEMQMDVVETITTVTTTTSAVVENEATQEDSFHSTQNSSLEMGDIVDEETLSSPAVLQQTPVALLQQLDPRSPTFGVDRTPIIFTDDDEEGEDQMLENILATLSLDMSSAANSIASFGSPRSTENYEPFKPTNKHLTRVQAGKMNAGKTKRPQRQQRIYIDQNDENSSKSTPTTPKQKRNGGEILSSPQDSQNRTPLSCMKNRSRSRSVEPLAKLSKTKINMSSYDDNSLNVSFGGKMSNALKMQQSQNK